MKRMFRKRTLFLASLFGLASWVLWPIYGFLSNQYETARLPWGWTSLPAQAPVGKSHVDPAYAGVDKIATEILETHRLKILAPSLSAAVSINGELVWANAVGWQDVAENKPAGPETVYRIGSTSKAVVATGLARLVANGAMELDVPISTYSNNLPNSAWDAFTPRQLISHTAGLAAYEENNDWVGFYHSLALRRHFDNPKQALSVFDGADILFEPGTRFHYSGFDNVLLSAVMQEAAGESFNALMSSLVFDPNHLITLQADNSEAVASKMAISYQTKFEKVKPWRSVDLSHKFAAGGYVSTPSDLALLGASWLDDSFIPASVRDSFWTPVRLSNGHVNNQDYALGFRRKTWPIKGVGDVEHLNHGGVSKGAQCWLMILPEYNMTIAILTNRRTEDFFDFADVYVDLLEVFIPASK